jgi:hypothetical protein
MQLDIVSPFSSVSGVLKLLLFFVLFLIVRGTPPLILYRSALDARERVSLAFFSATQLPLVLAITSIAHGTGHMRAWTAAAQPEEVTVAV